MSEDEKSQSLEGVKENFYEKDFEDANTTLTTLPLVAHVTEGQSEDDNVETVTLCRDLDEFQRAFDEDCVDIEAEACSPGYMNQDQLPFTSLLSKCEHSFLIHHIPIFGLDSHA